MRKAYKIVRTRRRCSDRRRPHTHQEIKASGHRSVLRFDDYIVRIRAKRSRPNLPTDRDDCWVWFAWAKHDSWKMLRESQYRQEGS